MATLVCQRRYDEMALEGFIVDIMGKVAQNIEKIQHLFKVDKFNKIKNLVRELKFYTQLNTQATKCSVWL
jgi:hypothetical protein